MPKICYGSVDVEPVRFRRVSPRTLAVGGATALGIAGVITAATAVFAPTAANARGLTPDETNRTFVKYKVREGGCTVYLNDPRHGPNRNDSWQIKQGKTVVWRASPDPAGRWAIVQDVGRAQRNENGKRSYPWWGYAERSCIGRSRGGQEYHPSGRLPPPKGQVARNPWYKHPLHDPHGRKPLMGWEPKHLKAAPGGPRVVKQVRVKSNSTLRGPRDIFVGNVRGGERVTLLPNVRVRGKGWYMACYAEAKTCGKIRHSQLGLTKAQRVKLRKLRR